MLLPIFFCYKTESLPPPTNIFYQNKTDTDLQQYNLSVSEGKNEHGFVMTVFRGYGSFQHLIGSFLFHFESSALHATLKVHPYSLMMAYHQHSFRRSDWNNKYTVFEMAPLMMANCSHYYDFKMQGACTQLPCTSWLFSLNRVQETPQTDYAD